MSNAASLKIAAVFYQISQPIIKAGVWFGRATSWIVLAVIAVVMITVLMNMFSLNELLRWETSIFIFDQAFTINSAAELQWYLYGVLVLFSATYALHTNTHVRVDLISQNFSLRTQYAIDLVGHLFFLMPFCILVAYLYWPQVMISFNSGEQSNFGGLTDRFIIKASLSVSLIFMGINAFGRVLYNLALIINPKITAEDAFYVR